MMADDHAKRDLLVQIVVSKKNDQAQHDETDHDNSVHSDAVKQDDQADDAVKPDDQAERGRLAQLDALKKDDQVKDDCLAQSDNLKQDDEAKDGRLAQLDALKMDDEAKRAWVTQLDALKKDCRDFVRDRSKKWEVIEKEHEAREEVYEAMRLEHQSDIRAAELKVVDYTNQQNAAKADGASQKFILPPFLTFLPPEIRNMIYRLVLVEPHQGYLKCYYDSWIFHKPGKNRLYVPDSVPLQLLQVSRQVNEEAGGLFYGENVFAIAEQQRANHKIPLSCLKKMRRPINVNRIQKLHITNRECKWLSDPFRTSPGVYREACKNHISTFADGLSPEGNQLKYLLIDCLSGFGSTMRQAMKFLKPMHMKVSTKHLAGLTKVHIVSTDPDHFPYLRYIEKCMVERSIKCFDSESRSWAGVLRDHHHEEEDENNVKDGNELAAFLKVSPCYPTTTASKST